MPKEKLGLDEVRKLVPWRAPAVEAAVNGEETRLSVRRSPGLVPKLLSYFFTLPAVKNYNLDKFGTAVWNLCDGKRNVGEVMKQFPRQPGWPEERTEAAVLQFLTQLSERKLVSFAPPGQNPAKMG
jgi:hypothetical protein